MPDQEAALQWATRLLDEQVQWYGLPTYPNQALALPQLGLVDQWGRQLASDVIPVPVQQATALYALGLLEATVENGATAASGDFILKSKKIAGYDPYVPGCVLCEHTCSGLTLRYPL